MCGICWLIFKQIDCVHHNEACEFWKTSRIQQRGPDSFYNCSTCDGQTISQFCGFTLHFQGELTPQPLINEAGNIFLWNGEVFGGIETNGRNDGMVILDQLNKCSTDVDVLSVFAKIYGPWSFIYWQDPWKEVPATGIYSMDVKADTLPRNNSITHYPYILNTDLSDCCKIEKMNANSTIFNNTVDKDSNIWEGFNIVESNLGIKIPISTFNSTFPSIDSKCEDSCMDASKITTDTIEKLASPEQLLLRDELINILGEAVKVRVERQSHLCHDCITNNLRSREFEVKCKVKTLLVNNDQDEEYSASSMTANKEVDNLTGEQKSTIHLSSQTSDKPDQSSCDKNTIKETSESDSSICSIDREQKEDCQLSVKDVRSCRGDDACKLLSVQKSCGHSRVAILFSGGIDSLVIAALADRYVPEGEPIDLLNVAFEQREKPHTDKKKTQDTSHVKQRGHFNVPDRITGIDGLKQLNSARQWNFVEINVTVDELQDARTRHVKGLVYPLNTVLDDSIGCAIWFAARGQGVIRKGDNISPYTTTTRVVLVGMGADEQLVGYSRHRVKYKNEGLTGLVAEIKMEIERISARNLGRDDRIISDHSKEARFPFLDEHVVSFLNDLPILQKANLDLPRGVGEKFLLRLAAVKLGLGDSSLLPKRAIQFGSRIAKIENKKEKASDVCDRL